MLPPFALAISQKKIQMMSDDEIRLLYGKKTIVSRKDRFVFVHLDRPSPAVVRARTEEFDPDEYFERECPICAIQRAGGVIVFDEFSADNDEDIVVD